MASDAAERLNQPIALDRPDQSLFNEAVLIYSNAVRRAARPAAAPADPGLLARRGRSRRATWPGCGPTATSCRSAARRDLSQRMHRQSLEFRKAAENIAMDKVYRLLGRPISMAHQGCSFTYGDTNGAGAGPHLREPRPGGGRALAGVAEAPRLAAVGELPAARRRRRASIPKGPACGDFYLVQNFAD